MAKLIDDLITDGVNVTRPMGDKWFMAKPIQYRVYGWSSFKSLMSDLWRIIVGKGFVVYYKEDEK